MAARRVPDVATSKNCLAAVNPSLATEWHPTKNGDVTPNNMMSGSSKKAWWQCPVCGHEWEAVVASRSVGNGCPACAGHVATSKNCLATVNPILAAE
jgi:rubrerythrin